MQHVTILLTFYTHLLHERCHQWSRNCLPVRSMSSPPVLSRFVVLILQFYVNLLQIIIYPLVLFPLAIVLSVLLRYTDSDNPVAIFKLFLTDNNVDTYRIQFARSVSGITIIWQTQSQKIGKPWRASKTGYRQNGLMLYAPD